MQYVQTTFLEQGPLLNLAPSASIWWTDTYITIKHNSVLSNFSTSIFTETPDMAINIKLLHLEKLNRFKILAYKYHYTVLVQRLIKTKSNLAKKGGKQYGAAIGEVPRWQNKKYNKSSKPYTSQLEAMIIRSHFVQDIH